MRFVRQMARSIRADIADRHKIRVQRYLPDARPITTKIQVPVAIRGEDHTRVDGIGPVERGAVRPRARPGVDDRPVVGPPPGAGGLRGRDTNRAVPTAALADGVVAVIRAGDFDRCRRPRRLPVALWDDAVLIQDVARLLPRAGERGRFVDDDARAHAVGVVLIADLENAGVVDLQICGMCRWEGRLAMDGYHSSGVGKEEYDSQVQNRDDDQNFYNATHESSIDRAASESRW